MPFGTFHTPTKYVIDFNKFMPIEVMVNFNTEGKYIPIYLRLTLGDQSMETYKIEAIQYTRVYDNWTLFCCVIINHGRKVEVLMYFHRMQCLWTIAN